MAQVQLPPTPPPLTTEPETFADISVQSASPTASPGPAPKEPLRVIAFDTQSTCAQLFSKGLSHHLRLGQITHPYVLAATLGPERISKKIGNERTRELWNGRADRASPRIKRTTYEGATNDLLRAMDKLEKAEKTAFVLEYPPFVMNRDIMANALHSDATIVSRMSNPTVIPDELFKLFTPIIFIQHPALVVPAWLRLAKDEYGSYTVDDDDFSLWTSLRWSRMLFDYLRSTQHLRRQDSVHSNRGAKFEPGYVATRPYVIDATDVASNTNAMLVATCRLLGIDVNVISQGWMAYFQKAASTLRKAIPSFFTAQSAMAERLLGTPATTIDLDVETKKWEREFGKDVAEMLRKKVNEEMVHYRYLLNFKVRILPSLTTTQFVQNLTGIPGRRSSAVTPTVADMEENAGHPLRIIRSAIDVDPDRRKSAHN